MKTARIFKHGGSQAVRLTKEFRFEGDEVTIERRGRAVVLTPRPARGLTTLADVARYLHDTHPEGSGFPDIARAREQQKRDLEW